MSIKPFRLTLFILLLLSVASGCRAGPSSTRVDLVGDGTPLPAYRADWLPREHGSLFSTSGACGSCHAGLVDEAGNDVSIDANWRSSIMANASRDPYWQASVRSEVLDHPHLKSVIEDKCATCHTPMAHFSAAVSGGESDLLDGGSLDGDHPDHTFAIDGVSCTVCHQVEEQGLGDPDSFSGGFSVDTERPRGQRLAYGPFPAVKGPAAVMRGSSGYWPVEGAQTKASELCATCHTLYTPYVDEQGEVAGTFPEQVPYLEWQHSHYRETDVCQDCHMPPAEGAVRIASSGGGPPRSPFAQHRFIGGNTYVLKMLWAFGQELDGTASSDHFASKIEQTLEQLQTNTATLVVEEARLVDSQLSFDVVVRTQTGHKFPTGFPARRAWLHVTVKDADGTVVFESGGFNPDGSILGNENDVDPATYEPHYEEITAADQVQIYEPILEDVPGGVTTALLRAQGYLKDNRLLPAGFDKASAGEDFAVYGGATGDASFAGGGDTVGYGIDVSENQGPFTVSAELLYQSIGYRWAENLRGQDAAEIARFVEAYDALDNVPVVVAESSISVEP